MQESRLSVQDAALFQDVLSLAGNPAATWTTVPGRKTSTNDGVAAWRTDAIPGVVFNVVRGARSVDVMNSAGEVVYPLELPERETALLEGTLSSRPDLSRTAPYLPDNGPSRTL